MGALVKNCEPPPEPSPDCSNCADCDGGGGSQITMTVSGFTGDCAELNDTMLLSASGVCEWQGGTTVLGTVICVAGNWAVDAQVSSFTAKCEPCPLICSPGSDHPVGSGALIGGSDCVGQTGSFTLT